MTEIVRSLESTATPVPGQPSVVVTPWAVDRCITLGSSRGNATHVDRVAVTDLMGSSDQTARFQQPLVELPIHFTRYCQIELMTDRMVQ